MLTFNNVDLFGDKVPLPKNGRKIFISYFVLTNLEYMNQGPYSQHFIFFVTYEFAQLARVFLPGDAFYSSVTQH
jgi:hypothetical protein